jgi:hypothetical protein
VGGLKFRGRRIITISEGEARVKGKMNMFCLRKMGICCDVSEVRIEEFLFLQWDTVNRDFLCSNVTWNMEARKFELRLTTEDCESAILTNAKVQGGKEGACQAGNVESIVDDNSFVSKGECQGPNSFDWKGGALIGKGNRLS